LHRFDGVGGSAGQDLTALGTRFSAREVLEAILYPSRVISDQYADTEFRTTYGELIVGRMEREDEQVVMVRTHPLVDELVEIPREEIVSRELSPLSQMPQGLLNVLSKEEILDLIAYLRSGADPSDAAFR